MFKKRLLYFLLFILIPNIWAQKDSITFQNKETITFIGFGENPVKPNYTLLNNIQTATDYEQKATAIINMANFHTAKGNLDSIIYYGKYLYNESFTLNNNHPKANYYIAVSSYLIAEGKRKKGLMNDALKWYIKGLSVAKKIKSRKLINKYKLGIGTINASRKEYDNAMTIFNECLSDTNDDSFKYEVSKRIGYIFLAQKKYTEAKNIFTKAITFFKNKNELKNELEMTIQLGVIAENKNKNKQAFKHYNAVKNKAEEQEYYDLYFQAQNRIGRLYYLSKEYKNAQIALNTAYTNAIEWNNLDYQQRILHNLKKVYIAMDDYKNAYAILSQSQNLSNQILKKQNKKEVNELEIKYKTLQKDIEIKRQKTVKIYLLIGFLIVLIPTIALLYTYYQKLQTQSKLNKIQEEVTKQKLNTLQKNQELKLIKAAIKGQDKERKRIAQELHDSIGGSLAGIKLQLSNIAQNNPDYNRIAKQIDETYNQVRDLSHTLIPKKFIDAQFTDLINQYIINLQKNDTTQLVFSPYPKNKINSLPETLKLTLFKIIQELITNTIKHAKAKEVIIHLNAFKDSINLLFEDNGIGFDTKMNKDGIGLTNIKSRVENLNGTIHIDSYLNRGTVIDINIPT